MSESANTSAPKGRLLMLSNDASADGDTCRTFVFKNESHTIGNALKNVILQNPQVTFCGYSIPHPAEDQMLVRIQTADGTTAQDALRKGLKDLKEICQVTKEKFNQEMKQFNDSQ